MAKKTRTYTEEQAVEMLRKRLDQVGGNIKSLAIRAKVSRTYLQEVLKGSRKIGPKLCEYLGLERLSFYVNKSP